jgi:uncharacterized protein YqgC (DUF456 family)
MSILLLVVCLLIMAVGLVGSILPVIPGIPLIYLGYVLYGLFSGWQHFGAGTIIFWGVVTAAAVAAEYYAGAVGARRSGSSIMGIWGSFIGAVIGMIVFNLAGLIIGTFAGAVVGELLAGRPPGAALRSGKGALIGFFAGSLFKLVVGLLMMGTFVWQVLIR